MSDLIDRQAAIDGFYEMASDMDYLCTVSDYVSFLESLPSVQPERKTVDLKIEKISKHQSDFSDLDAQPKTHDKRTETHASDLISRAAVIDEIVNTVSEIGLHDNSEVARYGATFRQHEIIDIIEGMPSAQPSSSRGHENDTISRRAAIDAVHKNYDVILDFTSDGQTISSSIEDILSELPSAQPERNRGKWIEDDDGWDEVIWRCSECDAVFTLVDGTPKENEYYFCPHCGADMKGEQE